MPGLHLVSGLTIWKRINMQWKFEMIALVPKRSQRVSTTMNKLKGILNAGKLLRLDICMY